MNRLSLAMVASLLIGAQGNASEYLVKYKNNLAINQIQQMSALAQSGIEIMGRHEAGSFVKVNISAKREMLTVARLKSNPNVEWVVPNFRLHTMGAPLEAQALRNQWAVVKVQAEKAWQRAGNRGSHSVTVAVIDTGVDYRHKNLAPNMVQGYDFKDNDSDPMDITGSQNPGHGTHCAGVIGATGLIENGTIGLGPDLSIMPIRFLGADGGGDLNNGIKSIDYAIEKGVQVISASWGATVQKSTAQPLIEAVQRADAAGIIFVAAAANNSANNDKSDVFPANSGFPNMISVAASSEKDTKPSWSNYGKASVHLASPGEGILSTLPGDKYGNLDGTSMATPLVAGLVGFLKSQDPTLTGSQIRALLQTTGAKANIETACNCRVDAFAAVDTLMSKKPWLVPAAATIPEGGTATVAVMNGTAPFKFTSNDAKVLTVDDQGVVHSIGKGTTTISVTDAAGLKISSLDYNVGTPAGGGGGGGGGEGECPFGDPQMCQIACQIMPELPFCSN